MTSGRVPATRASFIPPSQFNPENIPLETFRWKHSAENIPLTTLRLRLSETGDRLSTTMELELTEAERQELENLFLRAELLLRDVENLRAQFIETQKQIQERIKEIAKAKGFSQDDVRVKPEFQNYRLVRLILEQPGN